MAHLRKDPITKRWVITSTSRSAKPSDYVSVENPVESSIHTCPFCVGREDKMGIPIVEIADEQGNWKTRIVENKYPVLSENPSNEPYDEYVSNNSLYEYKAATGYHDVVIESASHYFDMYGATVDEIDCIFDIVIRRLTMLSEIKDMEYSLYFKNFGQEAGASIVHSHSQIITTPFLPHHITDKINGSYEYYYCNDSCIYCDIIAEEKRSGIRVVAENEKFIAFCPFASRSPYQVSILPKEHANSNIISIDEHTRYLFASIVVDVFGKIKKVLGMPAFNYVLSSLPKSMIRKYNDSFHFGLNIHPKLSKLAGFEIGSGVYINSVLPEHAAEMLRS